MGKGDKISNVKTKRWDENTIMSYCSAAYHVGELVVAELVGDIGSLVVGSDLVIVGSEVLKHAHEVVATLDLDTVLLKPGVEPALVVAALVEESSLGDCHKHGEEERAKEHHGCEDFKAFPSLEIFV